MRSKWPSGNSEDSDEVSRLFPPALLIERALLCTSTGQTARGTLQIAARPLAVSTQHLMLARSTGGRFNTPYCIPCGVASVLVDSPFGFASNEAPDFTEASLGRVCYFALCTARNENFGFTSFAEDMPAKRRCQAKLSFIYLYIYLFISHSLIEEQVVTGFIDEDRTN